MRERPILFQGAMVRALLAGAKTQTRRALRPQPPQHTAAVGRWQDPPGYDAAYWAFVREGPVEHDHPFAGAEIHGDPWRCPYGVPGDRLWVRESWAAHWMYDDVPPRDARCGREDLRDTDNRWFAADGPEGRSNLGLLPDGVRGKWRPSMFMPRWASRITLEVTGVRVERLQDISEADASAEGCERLTDGEPGYVFREEPDWKLCPQCGGTRLYTSYGANLGACFDTDCEKCDTYRKRYRWLWESINGPGSWDANPWVWVIEFKRVAKGAAFIAVSLPSDDAASLESHRFEVAATTVEVNPEVAAGVRANSETCGGGQQ